MPRDFFRNDYIPLKKEVKRLSKAGADSTERVLEDLNSYLSCPNLHRYPDGTWYSDIAAWVPAGYDYGYIPSGNPDNGTYAGYYIENGRVYFEGAIEYVDVYSPPGYVGVHFHEIDLLFGQLGLDSTMWPNQSGQPLPPEARPVSGFHTTLLLDQQNSEFGSPGAEATYGSSSSDRAEKVSGAKLDLFVSNTGYVHIKGLANKDGRAKRADGSVIFNGVPTGVILDLSGLSWKVADPG